mgnify:CR=1 FL=1
MGQQVSITELKEQIEVAKRGLAEMSPVINAADPLFQPAAMPAADFAGLAVGHEGDAPDALDQDMVANGDIATCKDFQFFHRPKRLERPFAVVESWTKGVLFDCRMCGRCHLSVTGMTCVMNCPKAIRNGPCGGVRANGHCEVKPAMPCVWVEAWKGAQSMRLGNAIRVPLAPRDHAIEGTSAWLRLSAENIDRQRTAKRRADEVLS